MSDPERFAKLSEVCIKISDGTHHSPKVQFADPGKGRFKYITSKNLRPWGMDLTDIAYVTEDVHRGIYDRCNPELGDVLLTKDGANTGMVAINTLDEEFSLLSSVALLKPDRSVLEPRYLRYFLESPEGIKRIAGKMTGTAIRRIILKHIKDAAMPLVPLPEQKRIVDDIEKQFTRLEAGVAALRRTQANLKRYRASVLKAACEGRLVPTEAELARAEGRSYETADQLLARYVKDFDPNAMLPHDAEGWGQYKIGSILEVCIGSTPSRKHPDYWNGEIAWVSSGEVAFCKIQRTRECITKAGFENSSVKLHPPGTVLLAMIGEGRTRGQAALLETEAANSQNSAALRPSAALNSTYLYYFLCGQYEQTRKTSSGNNQPALNKGRVQQIVLPVPPLAEQTRIVAEIERCLSVVDQLEATVTANLQGAIRLRQSILKRLFSGTL
jgi:type I restriction enzyme S subunit